MLLARCHSTGDITPNTGCIFKVGKWPWYTVWPHLTMCFTFAKMHHASFKGYKSFLWATQKTATCIYTYMAHLWVGGHKVPWFTSFICFCSAGLHLSQWYAWLKKYPDNSARRLIPSFLKVLKRPTIDKQNSNLWDKLIYSRSWIYYTQIHQVVYIIQ